MPVQSCVNADGYDLDDFLPRAIAYYTLRGALQAMPFNVSNPVLYYNRAAFVKAGLDPDDPPRSLEDLRVASQQLVDSGAVKYGLALDHSIDGGGGWFLEQWLAKADELYANNENGRAAPATNVLFAGPTGVEVLTFLQQMVHRRAGHRRRTERRVAGQPAQAGRPQGRGGDDDPHHRRARIRAEHPAGAAASPASPPRTSVSVPCLAPR